MTLDRDSLSGVSVFVYPIANSRHGFPNIPTCNGPGRSLFRLWRMQIRQQGTDKALSRARRNTGNHVCCILIRKNHRHRADIHSPAPPWFAQILVCRSRVGLSPARTDSLQIGAPQVGTTENDVCSIFIRQR